MNCIYKLCPAALYSAVQSHCSILSHDTLCHCLSSNSSLQNGEGKLGHLFHYCRSCKNTSTILLGECKSALFEIWLRHPANCIPVGHGLYTQFTRPFPSFVEVGRACETIAGHQVNIYKTTLWIHVSAQLLPISIPT